MKLQQWQNDIFKHYTQVALIQIPRYIQALYTSSTYSDTKPIQVHNVKNETLTYSMSGYFQDLSFQLNRRAMRRNYIEHNLDEDG